MKWYMLYIFVFDPLRQWTYSLILVQTPFDADFDQPAYKMISWNCELYPDYPCSRCLRGVWEYFQDLNLMMIMVVVNCFKWY